MKKKILLICLTLCMVALTFGCGSEEKEGKAKDYVKVGKYKGLEIEKVSAIKVTDADVESAIRTDLQTLELGQEVNGPAQLGDTTTIDYLGKIDGVAFQGGEAKDHKLTLGSGEFIDGFEEQVVGHSVGETFDIDVTFPENYGNELAGQKATFTINLKKIVRLPELTDDLLPKLGTKATTVKEYKELVKKELEASNKDVAQSKNQEVVIKALLEKCEMKKYPTNQLIRITKELVYQESYGAIMNNLGIDQAVQQTHGKNVEDYAKDLLMTELAVEYIAEKEDIVVSEKEYEEKTTELAAMYGETSVEGFVQSYESIYGEGYIKRMMLQEKVAAFLLKHAKEAK